MVQLSNSIMACLMCNSSEPKFFESQYSILDESKERYGLASLGLMSSFTWNNDPKRLLFVLSRYKFVASVLEGCGQVLEVGCGDGFASRIVAQSVKNLTISDLDVILLENAKKNAVDPYPALTIKHDFMESPTQELFDGIYLMDVLEHISSDEETKFLTNIKKSARSYGKVIIGMPTLESQVYASPASREGHINCKTKKEMHDCLSSIFPSVTMFSMNDEVVHTGFGPMSHYIIAICVC